jgi:2'-5' RNA ligase
MRLLTGIDLGDSLVSAVEASVARLRSRIQHSCPELTARWVPRDNLHLTLVFIGEVADQDSAAVRSALEPAFEVQPFALRIDGFGTFPPSGPLRVIWMGVAEGAPELSRLHGEVNRRLTRPGEARPYAPHLTVARIKEARGTVARVRRAGTAVSGQAGTTRVDAVTLFRSRLSANGSLYERLMRVPLQA